MREQRKPPRKPQPRNETRSQRNTKRREAPTSINCVRGCIEGERAGIKWVIYFDTPLGHSVKRMKLVEGIESFEGSPEIRERKTHKAEPANTSISASPTRHEKKKSATSLSLGQESGHSRRKDSSKVTSAPSTQSQSSSISKSLHGLDSIPNMYKNLPPPQAMLATDDDDSDSDGENPKPMKQIVVVDDDMSVSLMSGFLPDALKNKTLEKPQGFDRSMSISQVWEMPEAPMRTEVKHKKKLKRRKERKQSGAAVMHRRGDSSSRSSGNNSSGGIRPSLTKVPGSQRVSQKLVMESNSLLRQPSGMHLQTPVQKQSLLRQPSCMAMPTTPLRQPSGIMDLANPGDVDDMTYQFADGFGLATSRGNTIPMTPHSRQTNGSSSSTISHQNTPGSKNSLGEQSAQTFTQFNIGQTDNLEVVKKGDNVDEKGAHLLIAEIDLDEGSKGKAKRLGSFFANGSRRNSFLSNGSKSSKEENKNAKLSKSDHDEPSGEVRAFYQKRRKERGPRRRGPGKRGNGSGASIFSSSFSSFGGGSILGDFDMLDDDDGDDGQVNIAVTKY